MKDYEAERQNVLPDYMAEQLKLAYSCVNQLNKDRGGVDLGEIVIGRMIATALAMEIQQ